jgi:putative ABC transport system permease protein
MSEASFVTPGYFRALGVELLRGRLFDAHDDVKAPIALVVSESFARAVLSGEDALGKRLAAGSRGRPGAAAQARRQLDDDRRRRPRREERPARRRRRAAHVPLGAADVEPQPDARRPHDARSVDARRIAAPRVRAVDPNEPVFGVRTMEEVVAAALAERRFTMLLLALFAVTALLLSAIGIYGVMAYFVTQRTHEIGIRMALGASPGDVVGMVLGQGVRLAAAGVAAGIIGALAGDAGDCDAAVRRQPARSGDAGRARRRAHRRRAGARATCPARRATRVDPIRALRYE